MKIFFAVLLALAMVFGYGIFVYADCPDWHGYCYADNGKGKLLGDVTAGMCWKWKELSCDWCSGSTEPAGHCNNKYSQCQGNCWACNGKQGDYGVSCWDRGGNCHGSWCGDTATRSSSPR
ncbi:MAG: hypothetical protein PHU49_04215 [Syntrophorhabdaceae bacterium]|nr:hypothetical protein [Syntrophorhabdaceae bacterium]MDD5243200.1 hypothetical protein [Syntrophorhabdaceae bacterium]